MCDCQAQKHRLINNCLSCGRIVCEQEGAGPCLFCGTPVTGEPVRVTGYCTPDVLDKALRHRNKLLEFDRNSSKRTEVIDDETDYYKGS